jgi:1-aminocyclopropane-1-carboxylate deaminase
VSLTDFPRDPLLFGPSPVHPLERLSAHLGGPQIWAKREDCDSGLAFGGNKTRKLEYLVPDALACSADTLVDRWRAVQSHSAGRRRSRPARAEASDHRLGGLGFASWTQEVQQQEDQLGVFFDTIIVCSVTGSTQAGMIAGFAGQDRPRRVLGIDGSAKLEETAAQVAKIARNTAALIGLDRELSDDEITVLAGWAGDYYGIPVESTLDAIRLSGRLEGMIIDPVYEGKSMAGLIDLVRTGEITKDSTVLYAHLGGQPALNAYSALFRS